ADTLYYHLSRQKCVTDVKVRERTQNITISYTGERNIIIDILKDFSYAKAEVSETFLLNSGRELNDQYWQKIVGKIILRAGNKLFVPYQLRALAAAVKALKYIRQGIRTLARGKIEVSVLDGTAIGISILRKDYDTAGSVMFLLGIGEILEEWTHKKSVDDLARSMSLHIEKVWRLQDGQEILTDSAGIVPGDWIVVHMGNVIPFDGVVTAGEALVNQATLTGEALPVRKTIEGYVYAGTVVEEGELTICVREVVGSGKFDKIVKMIEESEKLKSSLEGKAEHLADKLVPYTLLGTGLVYLLTRNTTKALSVLMVDFSCALKMAMPIAVLSAIREAGSYHVTVKGGRYLEAMAEADTIVFDKTGTLTKARPVLVDVVSFNGRNPDELLRIAACLEEHFPHAMAKAVVDAANARNLVHEEMHSKVEYVVAHGISTMIEGKKAVLGSYHFVFEDEKCRIPEDMEERFHALPDEHSHLYLAIENELAAVVCIEDPLREEAADMIAALKRAGIRKVVMMTGDSDRTARAIAEKVGVDECYSEVLPEDKARFIEKEKANGSKVIQERRGYNY
ncbi:MAG: heavy metal translocating P-type ATPase, partial [Lachnospiraceae bacterium]|nr:heavy metal translocating P-type ATPase [Lachnospiraceae bacterium]